MYWLLCHPQHKPLPWEAVKNLLLIQSLAVQQRCA
jgi:hypothetical protein